MHFCFIGMQRSRIYCQNVATKKIVKDAFCNNQSTKHLNIIMRKCNITPCQKAKANNYRKSIKEVILTQKLLTYKWNVSDWSNVRLTSFLTKKEHKLFYLHTYSIR